MTNTRWLRRATLPVLAIVLSLAGCSMRSTPLQLATLTGIVTHAGPRPGAPPATAAAIVANTLTNTYWYVPAPYLRALISINVPRPRIDEAKDQTVWHFTEYSHGYIYGISATNVGFGWSYTLLVGSIAPDGSVKFSFAPLGAAVPKDPTTQAITIGDGSVVNQGASAAFLMQMTTGTASVSLTHWAYMVPVTPRDPQWRSLPGYPTTGVRNLPGLQTRIDYR